MKVDSKLLLIDLSKHLFSPLYSIYGGKLSERFATFCSSLILSGSSVYSPVSPRRPYYSSNPCRIPVGSLRTFVYLPAEVSPAVPHGNTSNQYSYRNISEVAFTSCSGIFELLQLLTLGKLFQKFCVSICLMKGLMFYRFGRRQFPPIDQ